MDKDVKNWSFTDVSRWLLSIGLEKHVNLFLKNEIDGYVLLSMTEDDIRSPALGVTKFRDIRKFGIEIEKLKDKKSSKPQKVENKLIDYITMFENALNEPDNMQTPFPYDSENMEDKKRESKTVENRWSDYGTMLENALNEPDDFQMKFDCDQLSVNDEMNERVVAESKVLNIPMDMDSPKMKLVTQWIKTIDEPEDGYGSLLTDDERIALMDSSNSYQFSKQALLTDRLKPDKFKKASVPLILKARFATSDFVSK